MVKGRSFKSTRNYLFAFLIGTIVFILVISLSYYFSYMEFNKNSYLQDQVAYSIFEDKLDYTFFNKGKCSKEHFDKITRDLYNNGNVMAKLENKLGKDNEIVIQRKKFYSLVELEHLEFLQMYEENCDLDMDYLLFFYSNKKQKIDLSDRAGRIVSNVRKTNDDIYVYSFDANLNTTIINKLKQKYNVSSHESPVVIVNGDEHVNNFNDINEIEKHLD